MNSKQLLQILPLILVLVILYFILFRPQQKAAKKHKAMLASLKRGDHVVTAGGFVGKVVRVHEGEVTLEASDNVRLVFLKQSISSVRPSDAATPLAKSDAEEKPTSTSRKKPNKSRDKDDASLESSHEDSKTLDIEADSADAVERGKGSES